MRKKIWEHDSSIFSYALNSELDHRFLKVKIDDLLEVIALGHFSLIKRHDDLTVLDV